MTPDKPRPIKARLVATAILLLYNGLANADQSIPDQYPDSLLYAKPIELIPNVWTAIGATAPTTFDNAGHNNNYTFLVGDSGVIVINGGSYLLASALHDEIRKVTEKPVVLVVNENGQGHAALGNGYWIDHGVPVIAHRDAKSSFEENGHAALSQLKRVTKERADATRVVLPNKTFDEKYTVDLGSIVVEIRYLGRSHSSGDVVVWLPKERLAISGDMAFHERLLPIFEETDTRQWLESWQRFEELDALYVIPGHGHPTNMAQVRRYTRDYLLFLRGEVQRLLDEGEDLEAAYKIDQSQYKHLDTFEELASRNSGRLFEQMEFE